MGLVDRQCCYLLLYFLEDVDPLVCVLICESSFGGFSGMRNMIVIEPLCYIVMILLFCVPLEIFSFNFLDELLEMIPPISIKLQTLVHKTI